MYKFRVYHRNAVKEDPETGKLVLDRNEFEQFIGRSVGHSIVALYDGTTERARGLYPNNKYKDEAESIELAKEYQEQHPNEKVFYVIEFDLRGCPRSYYPGSNLCIIRLIIDIFTQASLLNVVRS